MSQFATTRGGKALIGLLALAVIGVGVFALTRIHDDTAKPLAVSTDNTTTARSAPTTTPTTQPTTATPSATASPTCEGPNTKLNLSGSAQDSLLPDCGAPVVTHEQEQKTGLGLGCGGAYPVILYKTTTSAAKTSICGKNSSGESFHLVTEPKGGKVIDVPGTYDPQRDAFVGRSGGTTYSVLAYDGTLIITKDGTSKKQKSDGDWISLDNESDYD
ncbi:MAG: hypothetical protein JWR83_3052 [Aeromicrobium sp.]|nr:hypothetical protein [Aeromicrobium sp.]